ncbi:MAG: hypothetical protein NVSMB2_19110 [Chloroflexota bacterium]
MTMAGLAVWVMGAVVALRGQSLAISPRPEDARPWLVAAAVLGFISLRLLERDHPDREPGAATTPLTPVAGGLACASGGPQKTWLSSVSLSTRRGGGGLALAALGAVCTLVATLLLAYRQPASVATSIWLVGLLAVLVGATLISDGVKWPSRPATRRGLLEVVLFCGILVVATWLRLPDLAAIPPNVHGDEADVGLLARDILTGQMPTLFATSPAAEATAMTFAIHAATMRLFGDSLFGLRVGSVIEGVLSIAVLYVFARRLWGPRSAVLAASFMTIAAWHIHFSRTGFHYMQAPLALTLALYFLIRGVHHSRILDWVVCGFAIGLCLDVYYAARLAPVLIAIYLVFRALTERGFVRVHGVGVVAMCLSGLVFVAPMLAVYARREGSFIQRAAAVLVTSPPNLQHELDAYHVPGLGEVLAIQTQRTLEAFHIRGETSVEYGHPGPLFDVWTGALLAMAAVAVLFRPGSGRGILLASWVWLALLLGSVLTTDAMFSPHIVVAIPAFALGAALMLDRAWQAVSSLYGRRATYLCAIPVAILLGLALRANIHDYFDVHVVAYQPAGRFTLLSTYALSINDRYQLYVIGLDDWTLTYSTPRFLIPNPDAVDVRNHSLALPLASIPTSKGVAFLVESAADDAAQRMDSIRAAYPDGRETLIRQQTGRPVFTSYLVEHSALLASRPTVPGD